MTGIKPLTCPPIIETEFDWCLLQGRDLIYLDLHGQPSDVRWYGDDHLPALSAELVLRADLSGAVIFAINCYLADEGSPMMDALLDAGAKYVIGGADKNWAAGKFLLQGGTKLAQTFVRMMKLKVAPLQALTIAKARLNWSLKTNKFWGRSDLAANDALAFRAYYRKT